MRGISIGEEIVILGGVRLTFIVNGLEVLTWCCILDCDAEFGSSIDVLDEFVYILVPHPGIGVVEVLTECVE